MNAIIIFICRDKTPPNGICLLFIVWMHANTASYLFWFLLKCLFVGSWGQRTIFTTFLADSPDLSSDRISTSSFVFFALQIDRNRYFVGSTHHISASANKSLFTSLFWCLPPCHQSARHHNQTYFPQKERNVPTSNHSVLIWSSDVWSPVRTSEHCPGLLVLHLASITKLFLGCRK